MKRNSQFNSQTGNAAPWLIGCGVALIIAVVAVVVFGFFMVKKGKDMTTDFVVGAATQGVQDSNLDEESKQAMITRIESLAQDFKSGDITMEQMGRIVENLADGPIMSSLIAHTLEQTIIANSTLPPEEKEDARQQLQRVIHGMTQNQVSSQEMNDVMAPVLVDTTDGTSTSVSLKANPTEEELREVIENARTLADAKGIPNQEFSLDIGAELDRAIAEAKGEQPAAATP